MLPAHEATASLKTMAAAASSMPSICCQTHMLLLHLPLSLSTNGQQGHSALIGISQAEQ